MTDKNKTLIVFIADRSGSMTGYADPPMTKAARTTSGIHDMVREQRKLGVTEFALTAFDYHGGKTCLEKIKPGINGDAILAWTCQPRGWTPLLDALGVTITETGERLAAMPEDERPGRVMIVTATDGLENMSSEYTREQVAAMIKTQTEQFNWDFIYIGAGFEDFATEAASMQFASASTMSSTPVAMAAAYDASSAAMTRARVTGQSVSYSDAERQAVKDAEDQPPTLGGLFQQKGGK